MARPSFRDQMLRTREEAIVTSANRLLAQKGFDLMTVDEVAADVGIAKTSLYKHFASKEDLAAAAVIRLLRQALAFLDTLTPGAEPIDQLRALVRWTITLQLAGEIPSLPAPSSTLRAALTANTVYLELLTQLSEWLSRWIAAAQTTGTLDPGLPPEVVLYTLAARACDPVLGLIQSTGQHSNEQITAWQLSTCFDGLAGRRSAGP